MRDDLASAHDAAPKPRKTSLSTGGPATSAAIGPVRYPRLVAKDAECAALLKQRTLTNLYRQRTAWLDLAHRRLEAAVFAAYGWPAELSDDELLARLLALNHSRV